MHTDIIRKQQMEKGTRMGKIISSKETSRYFFCITTDGYTPVFNDFFSPRRVTCKVDLFEASSDRKREKRKNQAHLHTLLFFRLFFF